VDGKIKMLDMDSLQARVKELTVVYVNKLPEYQGVFSAFADRMMSNPDQSLIEEILRDAHKLAGSAGSYGFIDLGNAAANLEAGCQILLDTADISDEGVNDLSMTLITLINLIESTINSEKSDAQISP
jgi:HPt (histidine-containing phosphotransfer) domain-containing protein